MGGYFICNGIERIIRASCSRGGTSERPLRFGGRGGRRSKEQRRRQRR